MPWEVSTRRDGGLKFRHGEFKDKDGDSHNCGGGLFSIRYTGDSQLVVRCEGCRMKIDPKVFVKAWIEGPGEEAVAEAKKQKHAHAEEPKKEKKPGKLIKHNFGVVEGGNGEKDPQEDGEEPEAEEGEEEGDVDADE